MSYTFPASALHPRRWLHLPSLAILALAATAAYATHEVVDAWRGTQPRAREDARDQAGRMITIRGTASRSGISPTSITWAVRLTARARTEEAAERDLTRQREQLFVALADAGVPDADIVVLEGSLVEESRTITRTAADGTTSDEVIPTGQVGVQTVEIHSTNIRASLASYARASRSTAAVFSALTSPRCTQTTDSQLERELVGRAELDLRHNAETVVHTLGYGQLAQLVGTDVGRMAVNAETPCGTATATVDVTAIYRLR